ncbi:MAG: thioredoxin TrxC [Thermoanaerobaculia bacterium]|nr:thioredoxin TrxC [Thermoanaerobaculia bacterium]
MGAELVDCPACGATNRLGGDAGKRVPRCGRCRAYLPWVVSVTESTFDREIEAGVPVLVDFWADWCGPCHAVAPVLEEVAREKAGRLKVVKVDVDAHPGLQNRFRVSGIPTLILFRDGEAVDRVSGALPKGALLKRFGPHLEG